MANGAAITAGWEIAAAVVGSFGGLVATIVYLVKHYSKKDTDTTDKLLAVIGRNTEAHMKLTGSIDRNTEYTQNGSKRIEELYIEVMKKGN